MTSFLKVKNSDGLYRNMSTGVIVNRNTAQREEYLKRKKINEEKNKKIQETITKVDQLQIEINDINKKIDTLVELLTKSPTPLG